MLKKSLSGPATSLWHEFPGTCGAAPPDTGIKELLVNVAFTTRQGTLAALRKAARLTSGLHGSIRVIVPRVVPYPLELNRPPVSTRFMAGRVRELSAKAGVDLRFEIVLCREVAHAYAVALERNSLVIVGGTKRWWLTREARLARALTWKGHNVLFVDRRED